MMKKVFLYLDQEETETVMIFGSFEFEHLIETIHVIDFGFLNLHYSNTVILIIYGKIDCGETFIQ